MLKGLIRQRWFWSARIARPEQLASVIAFLASLEASNVNGAILPADYGWSAV
jgi:NAD(P)-dependent dehydrogenase (short-subunit alcohol dehydrogenase family)